ncbi:hypothetical protein ACLK17_25065 [Escherichia coli]
MNILLLLNARCQKFIALWRESVTSSSEILPLAVRLALLLAIRPYESQFIGSCCLFSHRAAPRHDTKTSPCEQRIIVRFSWSTINYSFKVKIKTIYFN